VSWGTDPQTLCPRTTERQPADRWTHPCPVTASLRNPSAEPTRRGRAREGHTVVPDDP